MIYFNASGTRRKNEKWVAFSPLVVVVSNTSKSLNNGPSSLTVFLLYSLMMVFRSQMMTKRIVKMRQEMVKMIRKVSTILVKLRTRRIWY